MANWLASHADQLVLSAIVLAEPRYFVAKQPDGRRKTQVGRILTAIDASVGSRFADFGEVDALAYGDLMSVMRRAGTPLPTIDGLIAAQALARGHTVATRNVRDYQRTGVTLIDPWAA